MATNEIGVQHPQGTDSFAPHTDMKALADSLAGRAIVPVVNVTERDAVYSTLASTGHNFAVEPLITYRTDAKVLEVNNGSQLDVLARAGATPYAMAAGITAITATSSAVYTVNSPWPVGRFTQAPIVTGVISSGTSGTAAATLRIDSFTTSSFRILVTGLPGTSTTFNVVWTAVQMTPTSATG